jgi:hypothetical protein
MRTEYNRKLIGTKPITKGIDSQLEAKNELLRVRAYMKLYTPKPFHYTQSDMRITEFNDLIEAEECLRNRDYIILLHKVENLFAVSDLACSSVYTSIVILLDRI